MPQPRIDAGGKRETRIGLAQIRRQAPQGAKNEWRLADRIDGLAADDHIRRRKRQHRRGGSGREPVANERQRHGENQRDVNHAAKQSGG